VSIVSVAKVVAVTGPDGMRRRNSSAPFKYTTAPSSTRFDAMSIQPGCTEGTVKRVRK
jgi:hypothetical protein